MAQDEDDEAPLGFAATTEPASDQRPSWGARAVRVSGACGAFGGLTSAVAGVPYYLAFAGKIAMDWGKEGSLFVALGASIGVALAVGACLGIATARGLRPHDGLVRRVLTVVLSAALTALVGTLPGAVGAAYFGAKHAPFMGISAIVLAPFVGAVASAFVVARAALSHEGRALTTGWLAVVAVVALVPFVSAGGFVALVVSDDEALRAMIQGAAALSSSTTDDMDPAGLARLGAIVGAALGAMLGGHTGLTVALASSRAVRSGEPSAPPRALDSDLRPMG